MHAVPCPRKLSIEFLFEFNPAGNSLPPVDRYRISCRTNEDTNGFSGQYARSIKTPDLKLTLDNARGISKTKLAIEVSFAEDYDDLVAGAGLWLDGMQSVCVVILAKHYESPPYRIPFGTLTQRTKNDFNFLTPGN